MSSALHKIEELNIPKKAPGSAGKQTVTDVKHDVTALGKDATKDKNTASSAVNDVKGGHGTSGLKSAEQDLTKGKDGLKTTENDLNKGKADATKAGGAAKAL